MSRVRSNTITLYDTSKGVEYSIKFGEEERFNAVCAFLNEMLGIASGHGATANRPPYYAISEDQNARLRAFLSQDKAQGRP